MIHSGIDLIHISRIEESLKNNRDAFLKRICTEVELQRIRGEVRTSQKVAGLFALKEAFAKALGTGIGPDLSFQDIQTSYLESGKPQVKYIGQKFCYQSSFWNISCSVSHDQDVIVAVVVVEGEI